MRTRLGTAITTLIIALALIPVAPALAQTVRVLVDGQPVAFDQPPVVTGGRVLVPLRGVFERLGASVAWDPRSNLVTATRENTQVQLTIGIRQASVNGQPVLLDVPPMIVAGRTLVPLRFVSEAMGARVDWDASTYTVVIYSASSGQPVPVQPAPQPQPVPPPGASQSVVEGIVVRVDTQASPQRILVQRDNLLHTFIVTPDTIITRVDVTTNQSVTIDIENLRPGDAVRVTGDAANRAILVRVAVREMSGRIDEVTSRAIALTDGRTFTFAIGVRFFLNGQEVSRDYLRPGMVVTLLLNPQTARVVEVDARGPVARPPAPPAQGAQITSLTHNAQGMLGAGAVLTVTLRGTPGGAATFDIFGVASEVPMREVAPGVYQGTYTIRAQDNVVNAIILGRLTIGGRQAPIVQAGSPVTIDTVPPKVVRRYPASGQTVSNVRPNILILYEDAGTGVNPAASRLIVEGQDVTSRATFADTAVSYTPPSPLSGQVTVRLVLADRAGNVTRDRYQFAVAAPEASLIRSVTVNPTTLQAGDVLTVTAVGQPGGQAFFRVEQVSQDVPMRESQPGVYVGTLAMPARDRVYENARVLVTLTRMGVASQAEASARLTIVAFNRVPAPVITSPAQGARVGDPIVVRGTAVPGYRVVVRVDFKGSLPVFNLTGTYGEVTATADANGRWTVTINRTARLPEAELTITAIAVDPLGRRSESAILTASAGP